jgi:GNAT superfamily N-acetyltransferase
MGITIREARAEDCVALSAIIEEVDRLHREALPERFKAPEGPAWARHYILNAIGALDEGLLLAEVEGQPVGFVHVLVRDVPDVPILVSRRYAVVEALAVHEALRRRNVGRALMERAEAWAKSRGATSIELNVYAFNQPARDFYRELGFATLSHKMTKPLDTGESPRQ